MKADDELKPISASETLLRIYGHLYTASYGFDQIADKIDRDHIRDAWTLVQALVKAQETP